MQIVDPNSAVGQAVAAWVLTKKRMASENRVHLPWQAWIAIPAGATAGLTVLLILAGMSLWWAVTWGVEVGLLLIAMLILQQMLVVRAAWAGIWAGTVFGGGSVLLWWLLHQWLVVRVVSGLGLVVGVLVFRWLWRRLGLGPRAQRFAGRFVAGRAAGVVRGFVASPDAASAHQTPETVVPASSGSGDGVVCLQIVPSVEHASDPDATARFIGSLVAGVGPRGVVRWITRISASGLDVFVEVPAALAAKTRFLSAFDVEMRPMSAPPVPWPPAVGCGARVRLTPGRTAVVPVGTTGDPHRRLARMAQQLALAGRDWVCVVTDTGVADDSVAYRRAVAAATESALDSGAPVVAADMLVLAEAGTEQRAMGLARDLAGVVAHEMTGENWLSLEPVQGWGRHRIDGEMRHRVLDRKHAWDTYAVALAPLLEPPTGETVSPLVTRLEEDSPATEAEPVGVLPDWNREDPRYALAVGRDPVTGRIVAVDATDTIAMGLWMRSGGGKSWTIASQILGIAAAGWGATYIAPDLQSVDVLGRYLAAHGHADRTTLIDFAAPDQVPWNPLALERGASTTACRAVTQAVVDAICAAGNWGANATKIRRSLVLVVQTLAELNALLPPREQCTLFQVCDLVRGERWRDLVLETLPAHVQMAWAGQHQKRLEAGLEPVLGLLESWRLSAGPTALLGMSESRWSVADDIDRQRIALLRVDPRSQEDQALAALVAADIVSSLYRRAATPDTKTLPWHLAVVDEAQAAARVFGPALEYLAQQGRKARLIASVATQDPRTLPQSLEQALVTNATWLGLNLGDARDEEQYRARLGAPAEARLAGLQRQIFGQLKRQEAGTAHMCLDTLHLEEMWGPLPDVTLPAPMGTVTAETAWAHQKDLPGRILSALGITAATSPPARPVVPDTLEGFGWTEAEADEDGFGGLD